MTKIFSISLIASAASLLVATPAVAQGYPDEYYRQAREAQQHATYVPDRPRTVGEAMQDCDRYIGLIKDERLALNAVERCRSDILRGQAEAGRSRRDNIRSMGDIQRIRSNVRRDNNRDLRDSARGFREWRNLILGH